MKLSEKIALKLTNSKTFAVNLKSIF